MKSQLFAVFIPEPNTTRVRAVPMKLWYPVEVSESGRTSSPPRFEQLMNALWPIQVRVSGRTSDVTDVFPLKASWAIWVTVYPPSTPVEKSRSVAVAFVLLFPMVSFVPLAVTFWRTTAP